MVFIEICKEEARKHGEREAIKAGFFTTWTPERIKGAFSYGHGTRADFERYRRDNVGNCIIKEVEEKDLAALYPNY